jgi:excisionase family DNA binding protein
MCKGEKHQKLDDHSGPAPRGLGISASARYMGATDWFVRSLCWEGKIKFARLGKRLILDKCDLDAFLDAQKAEAK